jgi:hypothetical protein
MDGTTYPRNTAGRFLPRPASRMPMLITLPDCCDEEEQMQDVRSTEYAKYVDLASSFFGSLTQVKFACGFDNNIPNLDNAVDYAEQL